MLSLVTHAQAWAARLRTDKRGVTALEYGLIAAAVVATVGVGFAGFAGSLSSKFTAIGNSLGG